MAAEAQDGEYVNNVAEGIRETERILTEKGVTPADARRMSSYRVFGGVNGNYGTGIQGMVTASDRWDSTSQIAQVYMNNMGAYYGSEEAARRAGRSSPGMPSRRPSPALTPWCSPVRAIPGVPSVSTTCTSSWAGSIFP